MLALEYAYRNYSVYDAILWISAESQPKIAESFGAIARRLKLTMGDEQMQQDLEHQRQLVLRWFRNTSKSGEFH